MSTIDEYKGCVFVLDDMLEMKQRDVPPSFSPTDDMKKLICIVYHNVFSSYLLQLETIAILSFDLPNLQKLYKAYSMI